MADEVDTLLSLLERAQAQLRAQGHDNWADWLLQDHTHIANHDAYGLSHLLSAYGGMGSINDLLVDQELRALLSQIHNCATHLLREIG